MNERYQNAVESVERFTDEINAAHDQQTRELILELEAAGHTKRASELRATLSVGELMQEASRYEDPDDDDEREGRGFLVHDNSEVLGCGVLDDSDLDPDEADEQASYREPLTEAEQDQLSHRLERVMEARHAAAVPGSMFEDDSDAVRQQQQRDEVPDVDRILNRAARAVRDLNW